MINSTKSKKEELMWRNILLLALALCDCLSRLVDLTGLTGRSLKFCFTFSMNASYIKQLK